MQAVDVRLCIAYGKLRRQEYPSNRLSPYCYAVSRNSPSYCSGVPYLRMN